MNILVTGATGFIGKHLVKELSKKHRVTCFARKDSSQKDIDFLKDCNAKIVYGDLFSLKDLKKAMKKNDAVFHLAGGGYVSTTFKKGYEELRKLNVIGTESVVRAAAESKIKKFVHFSSISAMGIITETKLDELSQCMPKTPHEVCKYEGEEIIDQYKDKLLITIIRPGIVYGEFGMNSEFIQLASVMKKHFFPIPGKGLNLMPWVYVGDIVNGTIVAFNKNKKSCERFIIVSSPEPSFNELIGTIAGEMENRVYIFHFPKFIWLSLGFVLEKLGNIFKFAPILNSVRARSMTSNRIYDISKIKKLGYTQKSNLKDSIKKTMSWYKENGYI
ncbi:MAG: NAD-dependent epimerase/dehydratase family protein [Candidatus Nanoarchaeia archaeon]